MLKCEALDRITEILNDFLEQFDCVAFPGSDFAYYTCSNKIEYALLVSDPQGVSFRAFAESLFPEIHADIFLWSFLHEIGHHETDDDFDDEDFREYQKVAFGRNVSDAEYYNLPMEKAATCWAGEFMMEHTNEVAALWNELAPAIQDFYNAMGVE